MDELAAESVRAGRRTLGRRTPDRPRSALATRRPWREGHSEYTTRVARALSPEYRALVVAASRDDCIAGPSLLWRPGDLAKCVYRQVLREVFFLMSASVREHTEGCALNGT